MKYLNVVTSPEEKKLMMKMLLEMLEMLKMK